MNYEISDYYRFWFRVWHPKYPDAGWDEPVMLYSYKESDQVFIQNALEYAWKNHEGEGCVIMQCTGLKDSEGALIYEGDFIRIESEPLYSIRWCDNGGGFEFLVYEDGERKEAHSHFTRHDAERAKVLGNIYENPELLNDKV